MNVGIVEDLNGLRIEWEELWQQVPDASPFQHPAWVLPWAQVYAPDRCRAAVLRDGHSLRAVVPAFVWGGALLLAGTGPSDHCSALFGIGCEGMADELLDRLVVDTFDDPFDRIDLKQISPGSPLGSDSDGESCVVLPLSGEQGMANVPTRMRSNWRYSMRRLKREGASVDLVPDDKAEEAGRELERLHSTRWRAEGEDGVLTDLARRHLQLAFPEFARAGLLRMHSIRTGAETVAILFAMRGVRSTCYYLSGFDPAWAKLSPGTALVGAAIAQAAEENCEEFDFLRGEEEYKYRWGANDRRMGRRVTSVPVRQPASAFA